MRFTGYLPEDAPDPRIAQAEKVKLLPVPVIGFVPQPSLEDAHMLSTMSSQGPTGMSQMAVGVSYTLWRNPDDHADPANLADLDDSLRRALDQPSPVPRPRWLIEQVERMRYPMLWEAVRTSWHREPSELSAPPRLLVEHANHILMNRFRAEMGLGDISTDRFAARLTERAVNTRRPVLLDGIEVPALEIDTDPFVYALGVELGPEASFTAVIPRDDLPHLHLAFTRRRGPHPEPAPEPARPKSS